MKTIEDTLDLRRVLGQFATGVTVVTCRSKTTGLGAATANSFASVSLAPPLVLWSIDKSSDQLQQFMSANHYAVNILAEDQTEISTKFAQPSLNKFAGIPYTDGIGGAPLLDDVIAQIECRVYERHEAGDHIIMIGEVLRTNWMPKRPLLYFAGGYSQLATD